MRSLFPLSICFLLTCLLVPAGVSAQMAASVSEEYTAFWYSEDDAGRVVRETISMLEYDNRKDTEIETKWIPVYMDFLSGDYTAHEDEGFTETQARRMVRMDPEMQNRVNNNPVYKEDTAKQMAEWAFFYEQLDLWNRYVERDIIKEELSDDERLTYDPNVVESTLPMVYERLQAHAREISERDASIYHTMVRRIEDSRASQERYEAWLQGREEAMMVFADKWARRYEGVEFEIDDTIYLVRNVSERPAPGQEDVMRDALPKNGVLLEVPREREVTPFDLVNEDGTLKKPQGR